MKRAGALDEMSVYQPILFRIYAITVYTMDHHFQGVYM